ncbi:MAG: ankyrin repeat domain-containing protein [Blastocatellia bacterium]|nr:ankyrin repeat domain-containing protein [Blastocatellia bacterium]
MPEFQIRTETLPARCEICHQADAFDPETNRCQRCQTVAEQHNSRLRFPARTIQNWQMWGDKLPFNRNPVQFGWYGGVLLASPVAAILSFGLLYEFEYELFRHAPWLLFMSLIGLWAMLTAGVGSLCATLVWLAVNRYVRADKPLPSSYRQISLRMSLHLLGIAFLSLLGSRMVAMSLYTPHKLHSGFKVVDPNLETLGQSGIQFPPHDLDSLFEIVSGSGQSEAISTLLFVGVSAEAKEKALIRAAAQGDTQTVGLLLAKGIPVPNDCEQIHTIVSLGMVYLGHGCDGKEQLQLEICRKDHPLVLAAQNGHLEVVKLLLEKTIRNTFREAALVSAIQKNQMAVVQFLLERNINVNGRGLDYETPIMAASRQGNLKLVKQLHQLGADLNGGNYHCETALSRALEHNQTEIVQYLLASGATANPSTIAQGPSPLKVAFDTLNTPMVRLLLQHNARLLKGEDQTALVAQAVRKSDHELVAMMLDYGLSASQPDHFETPLGIAAHQGDITMVKLLLAHKAAQEPSPHQCINEVQEAILGGNVEIALLLEGKRGSIKTDGKFLLATVANQGNYEMVKLLLEKGVPPNIPDTNGVTAFHYAQQKGDQRLLHILTPTQAK